jgi:cytochrome b561/polyisoprenoid-binding protein YceI
MIRNTPHTYGSVTKTFHWLTVLLILTLIPLGIIANGMAFDTSEQLSQKAWLFSLHKTLGITVFFVAVLRILWAWIGPKPGLLNANKPLESWLAETIHWLLYASLVLVPLTGWIHHSATTGFAPIWAPVSNLVGQSLPFVPKSETVAHTFASLHVIFERVLVIAFLLHIAGALKHHFIDKDLTLKRMLPGTTIPDIMPEQKHSKAPIIAAIGAYIIAITVGASLGLFNHKTDVPAVPTLAAVSSGWSVQEGSIDITVRQLGSDVKGSFADWTAAINFSETPNNNGLHGDVEVIISIPSLTIGSVTGQALGADFLAADSFATAVFKAPITSQDGRYAANGTIEIKGSMAPVNLPFTLNIDAETATMAGQTTLNRTNFQVGTQYPDESSLGFEVLVDIALTATREPN